MKALFYLLYQKAGPSCGPRRLRGAKRRKAVLPTGNRERRMLSQAPGYRALRRGDQSRQLLTSANSCCQAL